MGKKCTFGSMIPSICIVHCLQKHLPENCNILKFETQWVKGRGHATKYMYMYHSKMQFWSHKSILMYKMCDFVREQDLWEESSTFLTVCGSEVEITT